MFPVYRQNYKILAGTNDKIKTRKQNRAGEGQNIGKLTGERCANSEATNKQAGTGWTRPTRLTHWVVRLIARLTG